MSYGLNQCLVSVQDQKEEDGPGSGPQGEKELAAKEDLQSTAEDKEKKEDQENNDEDEDENKEDPKPNDIQDFDEVGILFACSWMCRLVLVAVFGLCTSFCTWPWTSLKWAYTVPAFLFVLLAWKLCRRDILAHFVFSGIAPLSNSSNVGSVNMLFERN